jgi:hypothetical protein
MSRQAAPIGTLAPNSKSKVANFADLMDPAILTLRLKFVGATADFATNA